jgi:hypothetical protein
MIVVFEIGFIIVIAVLLTLFFKNILFKRSRNARIIKNSTITQQQWEEAYHALPLLKGLSEEENKSLKELCVLFIHNKTFEAAQGFELTLEMLLVISLQACLPILKLGLECYDNFSTIIVYSAGFKTNRKKTDENGIVDYDRAQTLGESWLRGPVILSWYDAESAGEIDGSNLIIHEFAHKLDMQNGVANGFPPLHSGIKLSDWVRAFSKAYEYFERKCTGNKLHGISCYAATSPAEFFSVLSEVFFERPDRIKKYFPEIHSLLELYYRQTPIHRLS